MMRLRRASLLVAFYLLTSAATSYAACAWVLWLDQTTLVHTMAEREWTPITAAPNSRDCERWLATTIKGQSTPKPDETVEVDVNVIFKKSAKLHMTLRYVCLPDTVDPRGPKGK